jgi:hypothetical protein
MTNRSASARSLMRIANAAIELDKAKGGTRHPSPDEILDRFYEVAGLVPWLRKSVGLPISEGIFQEQKVN